MSCPVLPTLRHYGPDPNNHPDQKELSNIISDLHTGSDGNAPFVIGTDGVLRTLTQDCDVMEDMFRGAIGTKVPQEQWWKPDPSLLPPPLTAEEKARVKKNNEENREIIEENIRKMESGELKPCGVVIRSDFDIRPR
ncbi:uncharacterized protein ACLA_078290 [Aspergillus clavatus NRRL 1]|uniref:Uncharacterized protein n=1 Tax=Aspergillus clavatus (strain ATCC 1007 / CBS 513.65 / DSM 816 / NCTC 3887 / NRRL 1 / QM 1276 / 107) TaxID=344612 RepID=A1CLV2_ASPCL|nr:uncharacterized protein ACLA_078290 [Aspergillus clavatus NRRL 1]EAW09081.1 hypothetical protein ACLA_078290 [Aspergillus clavatus NRRL 1]